MTASSVASDQALASWQQSLLSALWAPTHDAALSRLPTQASVSRPFQWRGLAAYRSHAAAQALRTLAMAYPVAASLLGEENFEALARLLWCEQPPQRGDLAQWGAALPAQIGQLPEVLADLPYLADVARVEWALHSISTAGDRQADAASYALLSVEDPADLRLELAAGLSLLASPWPVVSLIEARRSAGPLPDLVAPRGETALVWRSGWRPVLRAAQAGESLFLQNVQAGQSLGSALEHAPDFDFGAWLLPAVQEGLLLRVLRQQAADPDRPPD